MLTRKELPGTSTKPTDWVGILRWSLLIAITLPLLNYLVYFIFRKPLPPNPQLIAHRGGLAHKPENSLSAFKNAISFGVDWIEFDVQQTKDGVLIVFHDETVDRTTSGSGRVEHLTFEQIRALDAGNGEVVPTFQEVITLAKEANMGILPEAKSPHLYPGISAQIIKELANNDYLENSIIQSFDHETLREFRMLSKETQPCPLYGLWDFDLSHPVPSDVTTLCPMAEMVILNPWMIKQAHAEGRSVYVWFGVIENPIIVRLLIQMGVDGLMLDDLSIMPEM
jgi:glycerophosphoryl diester phosphodiesterase